MISSRIKTNTFSRVMNYKEISKEMKAKIKNATVKSFILRALISFVSFSGWGRPPNQGLGSRARKPSDHHQSGAVFKQLEP